MEDPSSSPGDDKDKTFYVQGLRYGSLVTEFVGLMLVLGYVGYRLDERYGWSPWGSLAGFLLGMGLGLWLMIRQMSKINR